MNAFTHFISFSAHNFFVIFLYLPSAFILTLKPEKMDTPFVYDRYVTDRNFIGRKTECNTLRNLLSTKENVTIYGPPKSGKMSVIQQTLFNMRLSGARFIVGEASMFNVRDKNRFLTKFGSGIIRAAVSTPAEYEDIITRHLAGTHFVFDRQRFTSFEEVVSLNWDTDADDIKAMLSLPQKIAEDKGIRIYMILEEFQDLMMTDGYEEIFKTMETVLSEADRSKEGCCTFIITGSMLNAMKYIFEEKKYFHRMVEHLPLQPIDDKEIVEHIVKGFLISGKVIERDLAAGAVRLFRADMWYLNHFTAICDSLSKGYMNEGVLMEALRMIISIHEPRFHAMTCNLTDHQISLLKAVLEGETKFSASEVIARYGLNSSANVRRVKDALKKKEILTFNEKDEPVILDPLYRYWLEHHYFEMQ